MSEPVKVSIIIAAYEAGDYIHNAIASCLAQTEASFEMMVVDDASATSLEGAVQAAAGGDKRVKFVRLAKNSGPSEARNRGLDEARGDYVVILDADDTMRPDRLQTLLEKAVRQEADIVVDNMLTNRVGDAASSAARAFLTPSAIRDDMQIDLNVYADPNSNQRFGQPLGYLKPLIRRSCLEAAKLRYDPSLTNSEDYYLVAELLARGAKMILTPYVGYVYTIQAGSISHRLSPAQAAAIYQAEEGFQKRHSSQYSGDLKKAARRRLKYIRRDFEFETLIADLRGKNALKFVQHLFQYLPNAPAHIGKFAAIAFRRLA